MAYTKSAARYDQILVDGVDVSNSFRTFGRTGENETLPTTGFSPTGNAESVPGNTTSGFTGEAYYTPELEAILEPLFTNKTIAEVSWEPDGLNAGTPAFKTYVGNCYLNQFEISDEVGAVRTMTVRFDPADATGITANTST